MSADRYDPAVVIATIQGDLLPILLLLGIAMIGNTAFFIEGIRLGFRDRTYASSAACTLLFFAHDLSFILDFQRWFFEFDFWMWKLLWLNILISLIGEFIFFYQMLRYARHELFPGWSLGACIAALVSAQVAVFVAFVYVRTLIGDPLYLLSIPFTIFWLAPFAIRLTLTRNSGRGQSLWLNATYILMVVGLWPAWMRLDIPIFNSPLFLALGVVTIVWSLANMTVLLNQRQMVAAR